MPELAALFDDESVWRYLHVAHRLELAGASIRDMLHDGRTVEDAKRRFADDQFSDLTAEDIAFGVAFGQLLLPERVNLIVEYEALRYPVNVFTVDEWCSIKETLSRQLNRRG